MTNTPATTDHANKIDMQNRLFAELSAMFGREVPLYDKSLAVNARCNRVVCDLLASVWEGFGVTDAQLEKTSSERHGAIRIGRPDEYRWIARFFACFAMHPHNFYDMTSVGAKSQPVIASAFRSIVHPEHRVFSSLLQTNYFDRQTQERVEELLATRTVFSDEAKALIEKSEAHGGLSWDDAHALIREGTERIFKWTGRATDHALYTHLCDAGFKIAADVACFRAHHLNHLTPNTFCMDLYTSAMKFRLGELDDAEFRSRAHEALTRLVDDADAYFLRLHFKHLTGDEVSSFTHRPIDSFTLDAAVDRLSAALNTPELDLTALKHNGFKDFTEGPSDDTPVLLRQDAYRALTEPVRFSNPDGSTVDTVHTARFGEIEQRFYATTPRGRALYDECLAASTTHRTENAELARTDFKAYQAGQRACFTPFPKTLPELQAAGLVYVRYEATEAGRARAGTIDTTDLARLRAEGLVRFEGLRYEDFLPVSAAGIFASNLEQYGTQHSAAEKPTYTHAMLEEILGMPIIDADVVYRGLESASILKTYADLGLTDALAEGDRARLEADADGLPPEATVDFEHRAVLAAKA